MDEWQNSLRRATSWRASWPIAAVVACAFTATATASSGVARGGAPVETVIVRPADESSDKRFDYYWQLLDRALLVTRADFGPARLIATPTPLDDERARLDLQRGDGTVDVLVHGVTRDYDQSLRAVRVPLDKGLLGYRVFLIRAELQPQLYEVDSLAALSRFSIGQGRRWGDIGILRGAGLKVVEGGGYSGLFEMLEAGRFALLSRSVTEVIDELARFQTPTHSLAIERSLLLYYPLTRYFYVAPTAQGAELARRIETGLARMRADGSFNRLFGDFLKRFEGVLNLRSRRLLRIANLAAASQMPLQDASLWYDPTRAK